MLLIAPAIINYKVMPLKFKILAVQKKIKILQ